MSITVEQLELEVRSDATSASSGIDALASSLHKLREATAPVSKNGMGLGSLSNSLKKFSDSLSGLSGLSIAKEKIEDLADALKPLESVQKSGFGSLANGLDKLVKIAPQLDTVTESLKKTDLDAFADQCNRVTVAITPLANQMEKVAAGFSAFPAKIQRLLKGNTNLAASNKVLGSSYVALGAKIGISLVAMRRVASVLAGFINKSNEYIESLNLFTVSLGEYAGEAQKYAESVSEIVGIDPAEWLRNQGVFMTLATGFGVVNDRAYTMSKNLTQLGYDLSSFFNIPFADSMQKLQSGLAGELEPLRRLGYDLSVARLQQEAYTLGIKKKVSAMTQAEKAELRYYAIMTQVTTAQGDMARTLNAPANQLRVLQAQVTQCARALGNIFIPALNAVLPYVIALAKVIRIIADAIAKLFGFTLPEIDYSGVNTAVGGAVEGTENVADNLGTAAKKAKEVKNALLGIDELNVISKPEDNTSGSGVIDSIAGGSGLGFELPEYDFLGDAVTSKVNEIVQKMKEWLGITDDINSWAGLFDTRLGNILKSVIAISTGLAAWKIGKSVVQFLDKLESLKGPGNIFGSIGLIGFVSDLDEFRRYFDDFVQNGATFYNVVGMLSEFAGMMGDVLIILGNLKVGGALQVVKGLGEITANIKDITDNGLNWENALSVIRGLTNIAIGTGVFTRNIKVAAWGFALRGFTTIIREIATNWEAIKQGDWSGVDKVTLIVGGLDLLGGLVVALDVFSKLKGIANIGKATTAMQTVTTATETLDTTTSRLSPKLSSLAKNIGMGVLILGEVAAGVIIFAGAIAVVGWELGKVAEAWQPVIDNAGTVAIAIGVGTGLLLAIGVVAKTLGEDGKTMAMNVGIGTAILLELGVATGLFIAEIWAIGRGLDEIGKAWQPVIDNGETIAAGIGIGTGLLVGIGVVTAALGAVTVGTAGALPAAIAIGTGVLVELSVATVAFTESLVSVADEFSIRLSPALTDLNEKLPALTSDLSDFVDFMEAFASETIRYTKANGIAGISATVDKIVGFFTADPIATLSTEVENIGTQTKSLNSNLRVANCELQDAITLLTDYTGFMDDLGQIAGKDGTAKLSDGLKTNLKIVGSDIVTGFNEGIKSKYFLVQSTIKTWGNNVQSWFVGEMYGGVNKGKFESYAADIIDGFKNKISSASSMSKSNMQTWARDVKKYFTDIVSHDVFRDIAKDVIKGYNDGINGFYYLSRNYMKTWASDVKDTFKKELDSHSPSEVFKKIAFDTIGGYNIGIQSFGKTTRSVVDSWANSFTDVTPTIGFAVDTSALNYYDASTVKRTIETEVGGKFDVSASGFTDDVSTGISQSVSIANESVVAAIYALLDVVEDKEMSVSIGDETIGRSYDRYNRTRGVRVNSGAFSNAY